MKDITIRSFRDLKIEDKNVLDCITNPIAYAACSFDPVNYNKYFLLLICKFLLYYIKGRGTLSSWRINNV